MHKCNFCESIAEYTIKYYNKLYHCCRHCYNGASNQRNVKFYKKYKNILDVVTFNSVFRSLRQSIYKGI